MMFMVDNKMLCGMHIDKKTELNLLMAPIGEETYPESLNAEGVLPMDFTGRTMKGYIFIKPEAYDRQEDLEFWIQKCLDFNPLARASKKKEKKITVLKHLFQTIPVLLINISNFNKANYCHHNMI